MGDTSQLNYQYNIYIQTSGSTPPIYLIPKEITSFNKKDILFYDPNYQNTDTAYSNSNAPVSLDFNSYVKDDVTNIMFSHDTSPKKGHIAINDTDFPPPKSLVPPNVIDENHNFYITNLAINRNANERFDISLGFKTIGQQPLRFDASSVTHKNFSDSGRITAFVVMADFSSGTDTSHTYNISDIDPNTLSDNGVAFLFVRGNLNNDTVSLPEGIQKKAMFWLEP